MTYIWDTNILLHVLRNDAFAQNLEKRYDFLNPDNKIWISVVTVGEIYVIAMRNRWGKKKLELLRQKLMLLQTIPITHDVTLIKLYAEIDIYSQCQHPTLKMPLSARNMGKNDLWIAATTAACQGILISADADFDHLHNVFLYVEKIVV